MCKSQMGLFSGQQLAASMLMPDELHNWLLFRDLKADLAWLQDRPSGRPKWGF
jgi:hypothetical protein